MANQEPKAKRAVEKRSKTLDASTLRSCKAVTHTPTKAIVVMPQVRLQDLFPSKKNRGNGMSWSISHERYHAAAETVSSMFTERGRFVFGTESNI
jgi:hypothetical protein